MRSNRDSDTEKKSDQGEVPEIIRRLHQIADEKFMFDHSQSLEKQLYLLLDELQAEFDGLTADSVTDIDTYHKRVMAYSSFVGQKWGAFSHRHVNDIDELRYLLDTQQMTQDDTDAGQITGEDEKWMRMLDRKGIKIREASASEMQMIRNLLGTFADKCSKAWAVDNDETQERFTAFLAREGKIPTRLLWHGSGNENWWSIIHSGLSTNPEEVSIMGKMFGHGIYFATKVEKSIHFTSMKRPNQKRRFANTAFMGLYEVACGTPYHVYRYDPKFETFDGEKLQKSKKGTHCIHAHAGEMLKNEEIVIYQEGQATIRFLVELRQ